VSSAPLLARGAIDRKRSPAARARAITRAAIGAAFCSAAALAASPPGARSPPNLSRRPGDRTSDRGGFLIEERWTDAKAGVVMRFRRFNADYTAWEAGGQSLMRLTGSGDGRALFEATDDASDVRRIRCRARPDGAVEVTADRIDADGPYLVEFTLMRAG
jgi:hypothetical protein